MGGSLFPLPPRALQGNAVTTEMTRFQDPRWAHGGPTCCAGVGTWCWVYRDCACLCACVGVRARVFRPRVLGPGVRVCAVRARVPRVCTGVAAAGARPGRGSACPSLCAPARPLERSIASGQECACVG